MGLIYACQSPYNCLARYESGTVYLGQSSFVCGSYRDGYVYDAEGTLIATYCNNVLHSNEKEGLAFVVENNCICHGKTPFARFQGDKEGACATAYLYFRQQTCEDTTPTPTETKPTETTSKDGYWTFNDLWKNILEQTSTLVKVIVAAVLLIVGYHIFQLPAVVAYLVEEDFGPIMLCIWGGAFLFGFRRNTYPLFNCMKHVISWLWEFFIPYLHVAWIMVVVSCIYAAANGFFSFSYLAGMIYTLPAMSLSLSMPLYLMNLAKSLYLLYKHKR